MDPLRSQLVALLDWRDAHVDFDTAIANVPDDARGRQPAGLPFSPWQLLEHMRIAQRDILDFCREPVYEEPRWPDDYWPETVAPPAPGAWDASVAAFREDREAMKRLAADTSIDLLDKVPNGDGQTYLRELLLIADHNAYHIGQLVAVRRLLGAWEGG
jgi:uncharacterized damage-inducible protein DinB